VTKHTTFLSTKTKKEKIFVLPHCGLLMHIMGFTSLLVVLLALLSHPDTFQIHIEMSPNNEDLQSCLENIAETNKLALKVENGWLIIYKSHSNESIL